MVTLYYFIRIDEYTLQVTGEDSYIHGNVKLIYFKDIRQLV